MKIVTLTQELKSLKMTDNDPKNVWEITGSSE